VPGEREMHPPRVVALELIDLVDDAQPRRIPRVTGWSGSFTRSATVVSGP